MLLKYFLLALFRIDDKFKGVINVPIFVSSLTIIIGMLFALGAFLFM